MSSKLSARGWLGAPGVCALLALAGCARGPNVSTDQLPLHRVVIYRNGVGYFERAGRVEGEKVTFRMRGQTVGDFLATLAIVERGGSSVRSASFPIDVDDGTVDVPEPPPGTPEGASGARPAPPLPKKPDPNRLRDVVLHLDGQEHDLSIGYVAETPVWRPSYRIVVEPDGKASLQLWGIVQNLSGEDWNGVELGLVAGAPIAFRSMLGEPVVPDRPLVTDRGEVIAAVPTAETSLREDKAAQAPPAAPAPAAAMETEAADMDEGAATGPGGGARAAGGGEGRRFASKAAAGPRPSKKMAAMQGAVPRDFAAAGGGASLSAPRNTSVLAGVAVESGATRYELPVKVTIPDQSATMVLLSNATVSGAAVHLFAPDPGVPDSYSHPFRVARFANSTPGLLEKGPIAVFEKGSFLGEGVLDPLPPNATATVPFALERAIAVASEQRSDQAGARVYRIEAGTLTIERDNINKTTYHAKNGGADPAHLLIKHPREAGTTLHDPPPGTEDNIGTGSALVPVEVAAHSKADVVVDERRPYTYAVSWLDDLATLAVEAYLAAPKSDPKIVSQLGAAWKIRNTLRALTDEQTKLGGQQQELEAGASDTRSSLKAIEKSRQADDLRAKLVKRLTEIEGKLDQITKRLVELKLSISEQEIRLRDAIHDVRLEPPS